MIYQINIYTHSYTYLVNIYVENILNIYTKIILIKICSYVNKM